MNTIFSRPGSEAGFHLPHDWYDKGGLKGWRTVQSGQKEIPRIRKPGDDAQIKQIMDSWDPEIAKLVSQTGRTKKGEPSFLFPDASQMIAHGYYKADNSYHLTAITLQCGGKQSARGALLAAELAGWDLDIIQFEGTQKGIIAVKAAVQKEHDRRQQVVFESMTDWQATKLRDLVDIDLLKREVTAIDARDTPDAKKEANKRAEILLKIQGGHGYSGGNLQVTTKAEHNATLLTAIQDKLSHGTIPLSVVTSILHENINGLKSNGPKDKEPDFQRIAMQLGINLPWQPIASPTYGPAQTYQPGPPNAPRQGGPRVGANA